MRVAFLAPEFLPALGGVGTYSVELVKNLSKSRDIEVHVITPSRGRDYDKDKVMEYFNDRIEVHNISRADDSFFYNFSFQLAVLRDFGRLKKENKFDIVHSANLVHMPDIFLKFGKMDIPSLTTVHTTLKSQSHAGGSVRLEGAGKKSAVERMTSLAYPYISMMERKYLRETDNLIAVSDWVKGFVMGVSSPKNLEVIPNGVDIERFSPLARSQDEKRFWEDKLGESGRPVVLFCGRLMALKGLKTLIESMKDVLAEEDAYFVFAGPGDKEPWEKMIGSLGINNKNYLFLGQVGHDRIPSLYRKADIFVLPSFTESCPLTVIEAMATGLPVVASEVGGMSELISDGKDGLLVRPGDPAQLAERIISLLGDRRLRKRLGARARAKTEERFSSEVMARKTREYYEKVMVMQR